LHRPFTEQGVTSCNESSFGNEWILETVEDYKFKLKSWKSDYLHRPDSEQGVTTWHSGIGNEWTVEAVESKEGGKFYGLYVKGNED
jgi:hypothetical protein